MKVIDNFLSDDDWSLLKNTYINDILNRINITTVQHVLIKNYD